VLRPWLVATYKHSAVVSSQLRVCPCTIYGNAITPRGVGSLISTVEAVLFYTVLYPSVRRKRDELSQNCIVGRRQGHIRGPKKDGNHNVCTCTSVERDSLDDSALVVGYCLMHAAAASPLRRDRY
jgi:hypothetical protein